ncbi:MAG TPA: hypothetical protein VNJ01_03150 [Bacteriovoracaceae bacterium]|nr:hypothetical protein [Bacteriovoracaceae bacterium]
MAFRVTCISALLNLVLLLAGCADKSITNAVLQTAKEDFNPCASTGLNLPAGLTTISEDFNQGSGPAAYATPRGSCWRNYQDSYAGKIPSGYTTAFAVETLNGSSSNGRKLGIDYSSTFASNLTTSYAPWGPPDTGFDSGLFPYNLDLFKAPECYADVELRLPVRPITTGGTTTIYGALLNTTITGVGSRRRITGYLIHLNGGGNSSTLVKFDRAYDHALDFIDHFPGYVGNPNPQTDGPYKGWDFNNGPNPAGGFPNGDAEVMIAARYRYNSAAKSVVLNWEVRLSNGSDGSPGAYDATRTLSGTDALPPGGGYGVYLSMYGGLAAGTSNDLFVGPLTLDCRN